MKIGLSVSFCIRDIANGRVKLEDVDKIIGGTKVETPAQIDDLVERYCGLEWRENPNACEQLFRKMMTEGKIEQPRLSTTDPRKPYIGRGEHWVESEDQIIWSRD